MPKKPPPCRLPAVGWSAAVSGVNIGPPLPSTPMPLVSRTDWSKPELWVRQDSSEKPSGVRSTGSRGRTLAASRTTPTTSPSSSYSTGEYTPLSRCIGRLPCSIRSERNSVRSSWESSPRRFRSAKSSWSRISSRSRPGSTTPSTPISGRPSSPAGSGIGSWSPVGTKARCSENHTVTRPCGCSVPQPS